MKHRNILLVLVAFLAGIGIATVLPALAQQGGANGQWEILVATYSETNNAYIGVVKHNTATGQTLVLTCGNLCDKENEVWLDLPVKSAD
jgi:hypothetical protein